MKTGIDPTNDFAFKKIFGQPSHAGLTMSLVNSILPRVYSNQLPKGDGYDLHRPVISIWILKEELFRDGQWCHLVEARARPGDSLFSEDFLIVGLELGSFRRAMEAGRVGIDEGPGKWLPFLYEGEELDPARERDSERKEALMIMEEINMSEEELAVYLSRFDAETWRISELKAARKEGHEEGRAEGRVDGMSEGAQAKALEDARNFKRLGVSVAIIAEATGLAADVVEGLC